MIKLRNKFVFGYLGVSISAIILSLKTMITWFSSVLTPELTFALRLSTLSLFFIGGISLFVFAIDFILDYEIHYPYLQTTLIVFNLILSIIILLYSVFHPGFNQLSELMFSNKTSLTMLLTFLFIIILPLSIETIKNTKYTEVLN